MGGFTFDEQILGAALSARPGALAYRVGTFDRGHVEFDEHGFPAVIPRTAYAQLRWAF